jgi:hypothetical protein
MTNALLGAIFGAIVGLAVTLAAVWIVLLRYLGPMTVKPRASVHEPHDAEKEAQVEVTENMISRLADDIAAQAGVSPERARQEAEKLVDASETWGEGSW